MIGQIKEIRDDGLAVISGISGKSLKVNMWVSVTRADESLDRMSGWYHLIKNHIVKLTGLKEDHVHALLRYNAGWMEWLSDPDTGDDIISLKSVSKSEMDFDKWIELHDGLWYTLTINGLVVDSDTTIPTGYLELDYLEIEREKYKALREMSNDKKKEVSSEKL